MKNSVKKQGSQLWTMIVQKLKAVFLLVWGKIKNFFKKLFSAAFWIDIGKRLKHFFSPKRIAHNIVHYDWKKWAHKNLNWYGLGRFAWIVTRTVLLVGISFLILYPFIVKAIVSLMSINDIADNTVMFIPREGSTYFIQRALYNMSYWSSLLQTAFLSLLVALIQLFISAVVGYGFARFKFKGKNFLFFLVILSLIIPSQTIVIPLYNRFSLMGLLDTIWPVVILSMCGLGLKNGLYIYLMRQFFRGMPKELEQSAYVDGAGPLRTFISIMLPNAFNMMITVFLFSFTWQWTDTTYNSMLMPKVNILSNTILKVASGVDDALQAQALNDTATLWVVLPLLIVFLFAQRYFIQSIERSGLVE